MSRSGLLLVLDGPTAVGRTTTLRALADAWPEHRGGPLLEAGLASALAALGAGPAARFAPLLDRGPLARELVAGMHRAAAAWARAGFDVAIDHLLDDPALVADLREAAEGMTLVVIGLTCDPDVLEDREERSGHRPGRAAADVAALAAAAARTVRPVHDAVLDTTAATTGELVAEVLRIVARRISRT